MLPWDPDIEGEVENNREVKRLVGVVIHSKICFSAWFWNCHVQI